VRFLRKRKDIPRAVTVLPQRQPPAWRWAHRCYLLPTTQGAHGAREGKLRMADSAQVWCGRRCVVRAVLWQRTLQSVCPTNERHDRQVRCRGRWPLNGSRGCRIAAGRYGGARELESTSTRPCCGASQETACNTVRHRTLWWELWWVTMSGVDRALHSDAVLVRQKLPRKRAGAGEQPCQHKVRSCVQQIRDLIGKSPPGTKLAASNLV
jgi:hypothetical protein